MGRDVTGENRGSGGSNLGEDWVQFNQPISRGRCWLPPYFLLHKGAGPLYEI